VRSKKYDCEINPEKMNGASLETNLSNLLMLVKLFLDSIFAAAIIFPQELRLLLHELKEKVEIHFPDNRYSAIGGFVFLRYICPAIVAPEGFEIGKWKKDEVLSFLSPFFPLFVVLTKSTFVWHS
jgi:hypothetical protein